jgi:hypothetical protein
MNNFENQRIYNSNKLLNILEFAGNLLSQKTEMINNYKEKLILNKENYNNEINESNISEFLIKLSKIFNEDNKDTIIKNEEENNDLNLNSDIHLIEKISLENSKSNQNLIFILLYNIIIKNNLGHLHKSLTEKIIESYLFLKNIENFLYISIEQFEKIKFILNERVKPFNGNYIIFN